MIRSILRPAPQILLVLAFIASCGSGASTSCGCLGKTAPLAAPLDANHVIQEGAQAYITPAGFSFLDSDVGTLLANFLPGGLTFQVPEISNTEYYCPVSGSCPGNCTILGIDSCVSEYDYYVCRQQDCPYLPGDPNDCDASGADPNGACPVTARIDSLSLGTVTPDMLTATVTMDVDSSEYGLDANGNCVYGGSGAQCNNTIWISGSALAGIIPFNCDSPGIQLTIDGQQIDIGIQLTVDPISQALGFAITGITGPNGGPLFSASDINFNCGLTGDVLNFVSSYLIGDFNTEIQTQISAEMGKTLDKSLCMPQNYYTASVCPTSAAGVAAVPGFDQNGDPVCCAPGSACASATSASAGGAGCVVKPLGIVGTANLSSLLANYGAPNAQLQLEVFAGQDQPASQLPFVAQTGGGLRARLVTGTEALVPSSCVPPATPPPATGQADIDFDTEAANAGITGQDGGPYMVGVALSGAFLNEAAYEAYSAGMLCLDIDSYSVSILSTQVLTPVLPSLGYIAPNNAVYIVLRPQNPPTISIGAGTVQANPDGGPPQIVDPLLNVSIKGLRLDLFAVVDQRPVRLFSITTDVELPIALAPGAGGTSIEILLGNLSNALVNLTATNSNILAESPQQLLKLLPTFMGLAAPKLANLAPFALPNLDGFSLTIDGIHGIVSDGDGGYADIGIFADLGSAGPTGAMVTEDGVAPFAILAGNVEPALADVAPGGTLKSWPTAIVNVDQQGGPTESGWSIDGSMWSVWVRGGTLAISSPDFLIQGNHTIVLRTRRLGSNGRGWMQTLDFVADYTPPAVSLGLDDSGRFTLSATDNLTPAAQIEWSVSSAGAAFGPWATGTPDPNALAAAGTFVLRARDQVGNVTLVKSDPSAVAGGQAEGGSNGGVAPPPAAPAPAATSSCSSGTGASGALALLALAALLARRKR